MTRIDFELLPDGWGTLGEGLLFETGILGYTAKLPEPHQSELSEVGTLMLHPGFTWDFGSYAIDTPAMVIASSAHDALCLMTDKGLLPWSVRARSDKLFREVLQAHGVGLFRRWWCWAGVRAYSKTIAYWKRKEQPSRA